MEIRKFNVEIRSDGRVYATEYEEPGERLDIRDALCQISDECCSEMVIACSKHEVYALDALDRVQKSIARVLNTYWD